MTTIFKYNFSVEGASKIHIHEDAELISVGTDPLGNHCFWAMVDTSKPKEWKELLVFSTGESIETEDMDSLDHLGSYVAGAFVRHVFEVVTNPKKGLVRCLR